MGHQLVQTPTGGVAFAEGVSGALNGIVQAIVGTVARTDTTAKVLGILPANAIPLGFFIQNPAFSDAGTTATVSVGKVGGTATFYLPATTVKTPAGQFFPAAPTNNGATTNAAAATTVTGTYAETGGASTTGGPFTVVLLYIVP